MVIKMEWAAYFSSFAINNKNNKCAEKAKAGN